MTQRFSILTVFACIGIVMTALFYMTPPVHIRQIVVLVVYGTAYLWLLVRHRNLHFTMPKSIISLIVGFAWLYSSHVHAIRTMHPLHLIAMVMAGLAISFFCYLIIEELAQPFLPPRKSDSRWWTVLYAAVPMIGWLPYFLAYYPAKMNADSFWQWAQAHGITQYDNWHPILDTWLIQLTAWIHNSPATYIILQMLVMACVIAYSLRFMQSLGMPKWLIICIDLYYALNPATGMLAITMWKDILFAASILLLTVLFAQIVYNPSWIRKWHHSMFLIIVCFFTMTLRQNGPEVVMAVLIICIAIMQGLRRRFTLVAIPIVVMFAIFVGPVMRYFHVVPNKLNEALAIPSQQIAATYQYHGKFTPQLKSYFDEILPAQNWAKDYDPFTANPVKWDKQYDASIITENFGKYLSNWAQLLRLNAPTFIRAFFNQTAEIWQFSSPKLMHPYLDTPLNLQNYPLYVRIRANNDTTNPNTLIHESYETYVQTLQQAMPGRAVPTFAQFQRRVKRTLGPLHTNTRFSGLRRITNKAFYATNLNWKNYLIKGAIPFFLIILGLVASVVRYRIKGLIVYLPALCVVVTLAIAMPATDFRYQFGYAFSLPFLLFYAKLKSKQSNCKGND